MDRLISKTSFLAGVQCRKLLWKKLREREAFPPVDEARQSLFDQGHTIGNLAKTLYPGGIEVAEGVVSYKPVLEETAALLDRRVPLYEPAFAFEGGYARIDILVPDGTDAWRIVEVKSGTKVKPENILDVAFQLDLCRGAGLTITRCSLMHVNSSYVRNGPIDPAGLLVERDITDEVCEALPEIPDHLARLSEVASAKSCPEIAIGPHCTSPYTCDLKEQCWAFLPEYPITDLYRDNRGLRWDLLAAGIEALEDMPDNQKLGLNNKIQVEAARSGNPHVSSMALRRRLQLLKWPLAFFDIETTSTALPLYDATRPYQQVPFQFSLHVQNNKDGPVEHHEFLASGHDDPRPAFLEHLRRFLPSRGSVIAYSASFERTCLVRCALAFPEHDWVEHALERFHDLRVAFNKFWYHHRDQHGSNSLKSVLPALHGTDYSHLAIQDGNTAARTFVQAEFGEVSSEQREQLRRDLLAYCKLDTQAMVDLLDALQALATR